MRKKSMMKNVLAVAMAATVAISVTGCKGKKNQDAASSAPSTSLSDSASTAQSETPDTAEKEDTSAAASESKAESEAESKPDSNAASTENKTAESEAASDKAEKPAASQNTNPDNVSTKDGPAKAPVYNTHKTTTGTKTPAQKPAAVTPAATPAEKKSQPVYTFTVRHHDATCTTQGYDEHICNEWGGMNYNDNYVAAKGHSWDNGTVTKAATYTETGIKTFKCKDCGETRTEEIPSLDKTYHILQVVAPTCTSEGYTIYECNEVPGLTYKGDFTDKTPHTYDEGVVTKEATIYEKGVKTFTCSACGDTYTEDIPMVEKTWHKGDTVAPTCTEDGYTMHECVEDATKSFKDNIVPALGHEYKEVTTPATCKDAGSVDKVCERCNDKQHVRDIPVNEEHQWDEGVITKEPTATEPGIKTYTCTVCNKTKTESIAKVHVHEYTGLGEIVKEPSCETEGERWMYCTNDGCDSKILVPMPAIGSHDWDFEHTECLKKATCTEPGTMLMHCKRDASHTMTYSYGGTGHIWDEGVITTQPTHDEYGVKTLHCKNCDATMTEKVLPTKYTFTVTVVPPTCTEDGYTMHKCNEDDSFSYKDNIVHSTGHHAEMRVIEPTCKEEGRTEIYCTVCGEVSTVLSTTPKKDHTWDNGVVTTEPTTEHEGVKTYTCTGCGETKTESIARLPASAKVAANPIVAGTEAVVEVPAQEMSAESINAETYVAETPVESAVPAETPAEPVAPVEPAVPAETPAEPAAPVESAETEKSAETSEDSTDTKQEDADMPKETEAEVVIVEGAAE